MTPPREPVREAVADVAAERERQKGKGWSSAHDDMHTEGEIIWAYPWGAAARLQQAMDAPAAGQRAMLVKAAALIVAEIERLDRLAATERAAKEAGDG